MSRSRSRSSVVQRRTPFEWFDVKVNSFSGGEFTINTYCVWTLETLKAKIHAKTGIPVDEQRLIFDGNVLQHDDQTLSSYGLRQEAEATLVRSKSFLLGLKLRTMEVHLVEDSFILDVEASDSIKAVKAQI